MMEGAITIAVVVDKQLLCVPWTSLLLGGHSQKVKDSFIFRTDAMQSFSHASESINWV